MATRGEHSLPMRRVSSSRKRSSDSSYKTPHKSRRNNLSPNGTISKDHHPISGETSSNIKDIRSSTAEQEGEDNLDSWIDNSFFSGGLQMTKKRTSARKKRDARQISRTCMKVTEKSRPSTSTITELTSQKSNSACDEHVWNESADGLFSDLEIPNLDEIIESRDSGNSRILSQLNVSTSVKLDEAESSPSLVPGTPDAYVTQHRSFNEVDPLIGDCSELTQCPIDLKSQHATQNTQSQLLSSTSCEASSSQYKAKTLYPSQVSHDSDSDDSLLDTVQSPVSLNESANKHKVSVSVGNVRLNSCDRNTKFTSSSIDSDHNALPPTDTETPKTNITAPGSSPAKSFRERLKNMFLQNAKTPTAPSSRTMACRRQEMVDKAIQEAEDLRQRELTQPKSWTKGGDFYGLSDKVREMFKKHRGISKLYDWQDECLGLPALQSHSNLIYSLPTSGGKTLVAEILMLQELLLQQKDAIFILPFVSIVQEKVRGLSPFAVDLDFLVEEYAASKGNFPPKKRHKKKSVFICTIEKANSLVNSLIEHKRLDSIGLVIVDELHMLGEGGSRGAALEMSLSKMMHSSPSTQIVGMSATLNNTQDLQAFLHAEVYSSDFRPVELREYVKLEDMLYEIDHNALCPDDQLKHHSVISCKYTPSQRQFDPDRIGSLVMEVVPKHSCLVFCPTKKNCENVAELVCRVMPSEYMQEKALERRSLVAALLFDGNGQICPVLRHTVPYGVAYHHSGLTMDERKLIEEAYSEGTLCMLACTSTLAAGVNLPAKRVILRSPYVAANFLSSSQYKQMIGRAGRAGIDTSGESILVLQKRDRTKLLGLVSGPYDYCRSSLLYDNKKGIRCLLLTTVGLQITATTKSVCEFLCKTLCHIQRSFFDLDLLSVAREGLQSLVDLELIVQKRSSSQEVNNKVQGSTDDESPTLEVTKLGNAVVKGSVDLDYGARLYKDLCQSQDSLLPLIKDSTLDRTTEDKSSNNSKTDGSIDLDRGPQLYTDLREAQQSLVVANYLHLIYLVTPYDLADNVKPNWMVYLDELGCLDSGELKVCELIGVTESFIARRVSGQRIRKPVNESVVKRFYLTLMLYNLWRQRSIWDVSAKFNQPRGFIQQLLNSAASFAACVSHFCQELEEFWAYRDLLSNFVKRLSYCVSMELIPLLEIPGVKIGRARQLYTAGYKTLQLVAYADAEALVDKIQHLPQWTARQIISSAQMLLQERVESLVEEADELITMPTDISTETMETNQIVKNAS